MVFPMQMEDLSQFAILYDAFCGPRENRGPKRRLEEILDYDLDFNVLNNALTSDTFRPDVKRARNNYIPKELSLPYAQFGMTLLDTGPSLEIPAFGKDGTEEVAGKFDLIINSLTSLYNRESAPLEPNHLLFHFQGLNSIPYALGENNPACDPLKALIQIQVYEECEKVPLDDGVFHSCNDLEKEMRLTTKVQESYSLRFGHMNMDPLATLVSFKELRKHIKSSNEILRSQYASLLRNQSYISLKDKVVEQHGPNSVVALMVHMRSPEVFLNTFVPRGVLSSKTTGKHIEEPYQGKVTLQTQGLLNIDIEDGDQHLQQGSMLSSAYLYLIIEMKELVPGDSKFNFPWIRMFLTNRTVDAVTDDIVIESGGICTPARNGKLTKTIVFTLGRLRVGPHHVHDPCDIESKQRSQFDLLLSNKLPEYIVFSK